MKRCGKYHVRLDDGTCWGVDPPCDEQENSLEWLLRYGRPEDIIKHRMSIASVVGSYMALLYKPAKRRSQIVRDIRAALKESTE